jgi:hypothetical protein
MDDNTTPIVWWQSRIIWAQLIAAVFAVFGIIKMLLGYDVIAAMNLDPEKILTLVMIIIPAVTIIIRIVNPTPPVVSSAAKVTEAKQAIARTEARRAPQSGRPRSHRD